MGIRNSFLPRALRELLGERAVRAGCADQSAASNDPGLARYNACRRKTLHAVVSPAAG